MTINRLVSPSVSAATREDLLQASKAIHDTLAKRQEQRLHDVETEITLRIGGTVQRLVDGATKALETGQDKRLQTEFEKRLAVLDDQYIRRMKDLESVCIKRIEDTENYYAGIRTKDMELAQERQKNSDELHGQQMKFLVEEYTKRIDALEKSYQDKNAFLQSSLEQTMSRMEQLIGALNIPAPTIDVHSTAPVVNVSVPESVVNVQIPETLPPEVIVNLPEQKTMKKTISYDAYSRPVEITESVGN